MQSRVSQSSPNIKGNDWYALQLQQLVKNRIERQQEKTQWLHRRLQQQHPENQIQRSRQHCHELQKRLIRHSQFMLDFYHNKDIQEPVRFNDERS